MKLKKLLRENPDGVYVGNTRLSYTEGDAHAFGIHKGKAYFSDPGGVHFAIRDHLLDRGEIKEKDYDDFPYLRGDYKYPGRLWAEDKVISFWEFPKQNQIKSIISKLERGSGLKIWNNGWQVEVIDKGGKIYRPDSREDDPREPSWDAYDVQGDLMLIPIEKYEGSQKQRGKEISHMKSPLLKKGRREVPMGMGSKKKVKGQRKGETPAAARHRIRKGLGDGTIKLGELLLENPDGVSIGKYNLEWHRNAVPFGMWKNKMYVGSEGYTHGDMQSPDGWLSRKSLKFPGRLWYKKKVITFWEFPKKNQMKSIVSKIEDAFKEEHGKTIKIWNNGYKIEILDKGGKIYDPKDKRWGAWDDFPAGTAQKLIPLEDYQGSEKQVGKGKSHAVSPMLKKDKQVPKGMGSKKDVRGAKKGELPAAARHRMRKGLGDGVIRFKDLIREIIILYEDQSDELVKIAKGRNGLVDPKGQVHAVPELEHVDWLVKNVGKFKPFKSRLAHADANEWSIIYEAVINEAMKDGWVRISGRKGEIGFTATKKSLQRHKKLLDDIVIFAESVEKRPIKVYKSEFMIRKPQSARYGKKEFGDD